MHCLKVVLVVPIYTGDMQQLLHSIMTYLFTLPEEFPVYPGHGDATTIQHEKATNPFLIRDLFTI